MSRENVEVVRSAIEAFNRKDLRTLATLSHQDMELVSVLSEVDAEATYRGPESWATYFARMEDVWEHWRVEDLRIRDADAGRVAALYRLVGKGKHSGVPVDREVGLAIRLREGTLWRMRSYLDPDEALEAVGLRE